MSKMYGKRVHVIVERGPMEKIPVTVFEHEMRLMEIHHGAGSVQVQKEVPEGMDYDTIGEVVELDADTEWDRLMVKYGRHPDLNTTVCEYAFQGLKQNLIDAGSSPDQANKEIVEKTTVTKPDLIEWLEKLNIPFSKSDTKPVLQEVLHEAVLEILEISDIPTNDDDPLEALLKLVPPDVITSDVD